MKLELDKYYTPKEIAIYCTQQAVRVIGQENITEVIEPSIGNGSFITDVIRLNKGIDIEPQVVSSDIEIVKGDYLTMEIPLQMRVSWCWIIAWVVEVQESLVRI